MPRLPSVEIPQESGRVYGTTEGDPRFQDSGSTAVGQALGQKRQGSPTGADSASASDAALTRRLLPLYLVFVLDAVGLGVALPALPFFVMGLKASALQLAVVISSNYIAQTFGEDSRWHGLDYVSDCGG